MAHLVETLAYNHVRGLPWHELGTPFDTSEVQTWDDMRMASGLMWDITSSPLFAPNPVTGEFEPIEGWQRIHRDDTGATLYCARETYEPIDHNDMGEIVDALTKAADGEKIQLEWDTAGSLDDGRKVFATVAVGEPHFIGKDSSPVQKFLALLNAHDGTGSCKAIYTDVRVVCANTWHAADTIGGRDGTLFNFVHRKNWKDKVEDAKATLFGLKKEATLIRERMTDLIETPFTDEQYEVFLDRFIAMPPREIASKRVIDNIEANRQTFRMVASGSSPTMAGIRNTAYGVVQAAGEWLDHVRRWRSPGSYVNRTLLSPEQGKLGAIRLADEIVADKDTRKTVVAV